MVVTRQDPVLRLLQKPPFLDLPMLRPPRALLLLCLRMHACMRAMSHLSQALLLLCLRINIVSAVCLGAFSIGR